MTGQLLNSLWIASAVSVLIAQPLRSEVVQVTGVQVNQIENGIEVILKTPVAQQLQVLPRIDGNTYIADIPNAQLRLRSGNTFRQNNSTEGITAVTVINGDANSLRVTVTGSSGVPIVQLFDSDEGVSFSFTPAETNTQQQTATPNIDEIAFVPSYRFNDLGIFAQLQWEVSSKRSYAKGSRLAFSGGARYVNLNINTDDYTTFEGNDIEGSSLSADDVVFNAGITHNLTDELSLFASFSQGFSFPDIGSVLRSAPPGFAVSSDIDLTQPQKVDN